MAQIPRGHEALLTTDFSLEDVHFRRDWLPADSIGHRCLVRGLSDIAAMGGDPLAVFLSLAMPRKLPQRWVDEFLDGLLKLAAEFGVVLAGGDIASSPGKILADIVVLGSIPKGKAVLRSGARPGDRIFVTAALGGAAAALHLLAEGVKIKSADLESFFYPQPRVEAGRRIRKELRASAMIDISDGLSTDLKHICEESGVGAEVNAEAIPRARFGRAKVDMQFALHGGDDYELLFTVQPNGRVPARIGGVEAREIGRIRRGKDIFLKTGNRVRKLTPQGWEHFRK